MYADRYFVDRESGTYSDTCAAFGLAHLLSRALQDTGRSPQVSLKDYGTTYLLELGTPMTADIVDQAKYPAELLRVIQNEQANDGPPNYPLGEYIALLRSKTAAADGEADTEQAAQRELPDDFNVLGLVEQLQGDGLLNRLAEQLWKYRQHYPAFLRIALSVYTDTPNRLREGRDEFASWRHVNKANDFQRDDSLLAVFSPAWQKSINRAKPDSAENKNQDGFWLPEYLKMVGMPKCALVVSVRSGNSKFGDEDKKVYALAPVTVDLQTHTSVMKAFRRGIYRSSSIRADITVLLNYTEEFLSYIQHVGQKQRFGKVSHAVSGFYCAYFKKSSKQRSALSLTNLPFLQLPAWVRFRNDVPTGEEIGVYQSTIEHQREVLFYRYNESGKFEDFLDESKSEGHELLRCYREFLSASSLAAILDFFAGFAALVMQQASKQKPGQPSTYKQFNLTEVRRLILLMEPTLHDIIDDQGFQAVARAVRLCTVTAQWLKATKKKKPQHEIRYGLAQELKRKAPFKDEFTAAIMEFINTYQTENARYKERGGSNIHQVTTTHVRRLANLIDLCPGGSAEPVASLLLAYGYAFDDSRSEQEEEQEATDSTTDDSQGVTP
jgi:hypothetical protein